MIRSRKYEYIYSRKIEPGNQKIQNLKPEVYHQEPIKGNTGFCYVAGGRKQSIVQKIFEISVKWCNDRPDLDDQENFWDGLVATRRKKISDRDFVSSRARLPQGCSHKRSPPPHHVHFSFSRSTTFMHIPPKSRHRVFRNTWVLAAGASHFRAGWVARCSRSRCFGPLNPQEMMRASLPSDRFTVSRMLMRTLADGRRTWDPAARLVRAGWDQASSMISGG